MKKIIRLILIVVLVCVATGCDRLKYEAQNNAAPKAVVKTHKNVNRIPFNEAIEKCKLDEYYIYACLANHGWIASKEPTDNNWRDSYWKEDK